MTDEMIADLHYTIEQKNDDRSETLASLLGKMADIKGKTNYKSTRELIEYCMDFVNIDLNARYQKRKK